MRRWMIAGLWLALSLAAGAAGFGSAFTFQGRLTTTNGPANGLHDFDFGLWDREAGGTLLANLTFEEYPVSNGLFTVSLDFGTSVFAGAAARFVEVTVKRTNSTNAPVMLAPRTRVAPAPYALLAGEVPDGSIGTAKIALGAIDGNRLANGAVGFSQLGVWSVDLDRIADNAVTSNKLAPAAVHAFHVIPGAIGTGQLADDAVTTPKITNAAVTSSKIANAAVSNQHLAAASVGSIHLLANSVSSAKIADGSIVAADIAPGAITSNQLAAGTVDFAQLAKPYRSGVLALADATNTYAPRPLTIPFSPAFASPPVVTFSVMNSANGGMTVVELASRATTGAAARLRSEPQYQPVASQVTNRMTEPSPGLVALGTSLVPACVFATYEPGPFSTTPHGFTFARADSPVGRAWTNVVVNTNASRATLLADGAGLPFIAYTERIGASTKKGLFAVRATTSDGDAWSMPVNCDPGFEDVVAFDAARVGGRPAVVYTDARSVSNVVQLKYVRASDTNGAAWGTPVVLATAAISFAGPLIETPRLLMVAGAPAVYFAYSASDMRTLRANDGTGASWGTVTNVASGLSLAVMLDVGVMGGQPAVLVYRYGEPAYYYYRAKDATGTTWWPAWVVGHAAGEANYARVIDVDGVPGLSYSANGLYYTEANFATGSSWNPRVRIDASVDALGSRLFWTGGGLAQFVLSDDRRRLGYLWSGPSPVELHWTAVQP